MRVPQRIYSGSHAPPVFGGVALVPLFFSRSARWELFIGDNHSGMREIAECSFVPPCAEILSHPPPLNAGQKPCGPVGHQKPPDLPLFQPTSSRSANRTARHVK